MTRIRRGRTQARCRGEAAETEVRGKLVATYMASQRPRAIEARDSATEFLLRCGHGVLTAPQLLALKATGERLTPGDWEQVAQLAHPHRMSSLVFKHAAHASLLPVMPDTVGDALRTDYCSAIVVNRTLQIALESILATFAARQIQAIPLKGVWLAARYYPELALRPASDLDLLLRPKQLAAGARALATLGYLPQAGSESQIGRHALRFLELRLAKPQGPTIELHSTLTRAPSYRKSLPVPQVWERSLTRQIGNHVVRCLAVQDELWYLCLHYAVQHEDPRWFWLVDIAQIVEALPATWSWSAFVSATVACGLATPVARTLQDANDRFDAGVPAFALDTLWNESASAKERAAWKQAHAAFASPARAGGHLLMLHGARARLGFAFDIARFGSLSALRIVRRRRP